MGLILFNRKNKPIKRDLYNIQRKATEAQQASDLFNSTTIFDVSDYKTVNISVSASVETETDGLTNTSATPFSIDTVCLLKNIGVSFLLRAGTITYFRIRLEINDITGSPRGFNCVLVVDPTTGTGNLNIPVNILLNGNSPCTLTHFRTVTGATYDIEVNLNYVDIV